VGNIAALCPRHAIVAGGCSFLTKTPRAAPVFAPSIPIAFGSPLSAAGGRRSSAIQHPMWTANSP
jgi:hypothetical protein